MENINNRPITLEPLSKLGVTPKEAYTINSRTYYKYFYAKGTELITAQCELC